MTTKYTKALKQVLSIIPFVIINYYIRGIYEASFATNDEDEQFRLIELMKNTFETAYEILGPEYDERPYASITGGRKGALGLMAPMILDKIDMFLDRMIRKAAGFSNVRNVRRTKDYIEFYSVYAARLYKNLTQRMRNNEKNCLKFIDDLNELETLYQETKGQESEVAWYHSHALYIAMAFFFCREYRYEDELASQVVQNGMKRLKEIMEADGDYHEKENYIKSLMILYENDDNNFYKSKLEIWEEIRSYLIEFMESGDQDEERKNLFHCFFRHHPNP